MTSTWPLGTLGSVFALLTATLHQGNLIGATRSGIVIMNWVTFISQIVIGRFSFYVDLFLLSLATTRLLPSLTSMCVTRTTYNFRVPGFILSFLVGLCFTYLRFLRCICLFCLSLFCVSFSNIFFLFNTYSLLYKLLIYDNLSSPG
jgi:hypothetical protein